MRTAVVITVVLASVAGGAQAQAPAAYSAATVKLNTSGERGGAYNGRPDGGLAIRNYTLRDIISNVYGLGMGQLVGGPSWITQARFDIVAVAEGSPSREQRIEMAKALLSERFKLVVSRQTRPVPIYALVLARPDGRLGPAIKPSTTDCAAIRAAREAGTPPPGPQPMCGVSNGPGQLKAGGALLRNVASNLSVFAGRPVQDRTGLTGTFDLELTWAMQLGPAAAGPQDGPSLFTAIQEQLGLKLEAQEAPMEVLVVERAEMPTEN